MYERLLDDIYGVFASTEWRALGYPTFPENYGGSVGSTPYIRISILLAGELDRYSLGKSLRGQLRLAIFINNEEGDRKLFSMGDEFDQFFEGKILTNGTQFGTSNLVLVGRDTDDPSIYRADYVINFNNYGDS